jgi:hypothetical protein
LQVYVTYKPLILDSFNNRSIHFHSNSSLCICYLSHCIAYDIDERQQILNSIDNYFPWNMWQTPLRYANSSKWQRKGSGTCDRPGQDSDGESTWPLGIESCTEWV